MSTNPLISSSWNQQPQNVMQSTPFQMPAFEQGTKAGTNIFDSGLGNPGGYSNPKGPYEIQRNMAIENLIAAQMKNRMAPEFAKMFGKYGTGAGDFFMNLMDKGSPYYKEHQAEAFTQGAKGNQDAAAMANQELNARGFGYSPSGANAAMIGGMAMQGANNLAEQYIQNLFNNEQLQFAGAQGAQGTAQMFNPTQLLGGTSAGTNIDAHPSFFQNLDSVMSGIGSMLGGGGKLAAGVQGVPG